MGKHRHDAASTRQIELDGCSMSITRWCETLNLSPHSVTDRLRLGWTVERALGTPTKRGFAEAMARHQLALQASHAKRRATAAGG